MENKENTGTKLNVLLCNLVDYVRGDDRPLVFAVMQEITEYFEQELDKAKIEVLTEIFQTCYQEDSKTLELVEEKLAKLKGNE